MDLTGQMPAQSPRLVSAVPGASPQPCPHPAVICGHAARAERRRARQGRLGSAASARRAQGSSWMSCSSPCTAAGQGKRAPSAVERGGGKGYCSEQTKAAHLANCGKKCAVLTGYDNNSALMGCGIAWKEKTQAKVNHTYRSYKYCQHFYQNCRRPKWAALAQAAEAAPSVFDPRCIHIQQEVGQLTQPFLPGCSIGVKGSYSTMTVLDTSAANLMPALSPEMLKSLCLSFQHLQKNTNLLIVLFMLQ